jgi:maltooligosyltrehalose trehalohydrolase
VNADDPAAAAREEERPGELDWAGSVWAPAAATVELEVDGRTVPAEPRSGGWWVPPEPLAVGARYGFHLDGGPVLPDPRSRSQPDGVHGLSEVVDLSAFAWTDDGWTPPRWRDAVVYEVHVGTFSPTGTFRGAIGLLDHLVDLGVTHLELMPVAAFPGDFGWGYDGVDLWAPHPRYGTPAELQALVDAAHARGLAVVLDVVYNHLGPDGNHLAAFGPYFTDRHTTPWGDAVNLDGPGSDEVRRFIVDNARMWVEDHHVDALRLDATHELHDDRAVHLLEELSQAIGRSADRLGREVVLIAESDRSDPRLVRPAERGGLGLDAQWDDDLHHALHVTLTGEQTGYYEDYVGIDDVRRALEETFVFADRYSPHRGRRHGRSALEVPTEAFVVSLQNHDQVGNRAGGERLHHLVGVDRTCAAAALVLLGPYVPMVFQGEELAVREPFPYFADHRGELGEAVRRGRLAEFSGHGWEGADVPDPTAAATHRSAVIDWDAAHAGGEDVLDWYRSLVALRRRVPELAGGGPRPEVVVDGTVVTMIRGAVEVVVNLGPDPAAVTVAGGEVLLARNGSAQPGRLDAGSVVVRRRE